MKTILTLTLSLSLMAAYSQQSKEPFRKANTIIIHTDETAEQAYKRLASVLMENGFAVAYSDKDLGVITTDSKAEGRINIMLSARIVEGNSTAIHLTGKYEPNYLEGSNMFAIENKGMNGSDTKKAWNALEKISKSYPDTEIAYSRN